MAQEMMLEKRVALIGEFLDAMPKIAHHVDFLNSSRFSNLEQGNQFMLDSAKGILKGLDAAEESQFEEYERLFCRGKYADPKTKMAIDYEAASTVGRRIVELRASAYMLMIELAESMQANTIVYNLDGGLGWLLSYAQLRPHAFTAFSGNPTSSRLPALFEMLTKYIQKT